MLAKGQLNGMYIIIILNSITVVLYLKYICFKLELIFEATLIDKITYFYDFKSVNLDKE